MSEDLIRFTPPAARENPLSDVQRARVSMRIGGKARLRADVQVTPAGLLAIGGLVSGILLSTSVLVGVSARARQKAAARGAEPALPPAGVR